jgi:glycosyltransferase involved in cell wall biosynthesis
VEPNERRRVAVYLELAFRQDERGYSADRAFVRFLLALRPHVDRLVLMGRVDPAPGRASYAIPDDVEFAPLPHYPSLHHVGGVVRAVPATRRAVRRALEDVDVVWAIGPHPMSIPVARIGLKSGKRVVLGVRQHFPDYVRHRLPSARWKPALAAAQLLEAGFRRLARRVPVIAVGPDLADRYRRLGADVLELEISLVREADLSVPDERAPLDGQRVELLSVGRLDPEKAPELLLEMLHELGDGYRLTIVGTGKLEAQMREASAPLGDRVRFLGYVAQGPDLFGLYREADVFVHVARTEGLPQVLIEAQAFGLPAVGTDVGGVAGALGHGEAGLLVPPGDAAALAEAVRRLVGDDALRERIRAAGRARTRELTLERQAAKAAAFLLGDASVPLADASSDVKL